MRIQLIILLFLPTVVLAQQNLAKLLFDLVDSKDSRYLLEKNGWETASIDNCTDYPKNLCNQAWFSKDIKFKKGGRYNVTILVKEFEGYSNIVAVAMRHKGFYKHFENIIKKSEYIQISKDVEDNLLTTIYKKKRLEIRLREKLNDIYHITISNYHDLSTLKKYYKSAPPPPPVEEVVVVEDEVEIEDTESYNAPFGEIEEESDEEFFMVVENMPVFPGGDFALMKYIQMNVKYPPIAKEYGITGKVYVSYIVDKKGYVTNVKIVRGVDKNLDAEALRVVKSLPKYTPGKKRGKPVRVMFTMPINFTLN